MRGRARALLLSLGAGQLDAGFAALSGFAIGIAAARLLEPAELGVYALLFSAYAVVSQFPTQLVFTPAEIWASRAEVERRGPAVRWSTRRGLLFSLPAAALVGLGVVPAGDTVSSDAIRTLVLTAMLFTLISPLQDHVRKMLHLAERSWWAANVSLVQLGVTGVAIFLMWGGDSLLIPFGAATISNVVSTAVGVFASAKGRQSKAPPIRELLGDGRWLLGVGFANSAGRWLSLALVGAIAGPAALGFVENARIVARPADVVTIGLLAVLRPKLMTAGAERDERGARQLRKTYFTILGLMTIGYAGLVAVDWVGNPLARILPNAYEVPGLVAVVLIAFAVANATAPFLSELVGARRMRPIAAAEGTSQVTQVLGGLTAFAVGAFAVPISNGAHALIKLVMYRRTLRRMYRG